jgi:hypothetical protein
MWVGPGADVARSWCRCGSVPARTLPGPGADVLRCGRRCGPPGRSGAHFPSQRGSRVMTRPKCRSRRVRARCDNKCRVATRRNRVATHRNRVATHRNRRAEPALGQATADGPEACRFAPPLADVCLLPCPAHAIAPSRRSTTASHGPRAADTGWRGHARAISPSTRGTGLRARDAALSSSRAPALTLMLACALPAPPAATLPRAGPHAVQPCRTARIERALAARALCADPSAAADGGGRRRTSLSALWTLHLRGRPSAAWAGLRCDDVRRSCAKRAVPLGSTQWGTQGVVKAYG